MNNTHSGEERDDVWDEFKWEQFMQEQDRKVDRMMELMDRYRHDPNCNEIIAGEMGWTWLLEQRDIQENDKEAKGLQEIDEQGDFDDDLDGEEWKSLLSESDDFLEDENLNRYESLPAFECAHEFGMRAYKFVMDMPEALREDSDVVDFASYSMIAAAKLAGGACFNDDETMLGGNIAYCKRGLNASNKAIDSLQAMRDKKLLTEEDYISLFKSAKEARDGIALYVVELRDKFRNSRHI